MFVYCRNFACACFFLFSLERSFIFLVGHFVGYFLRLRIDKSNLPRDGLHQEIEKPNSDILGTCGKRLRITITSWTAENATPQVRRELQGCWRRKTARSTACDERHGEPSDQKSATMCLSQGENLGSAVSSDEAVHRSTAYFGRPSRCSRSTLTTVCFCFCFCFCASVSESAASRQIPSSTRHHHLVVECGIHGP